MNSGSKSYCPAAVQIWYSARRCWALYCCVSMALFLKQLDPGEPGRDPQGYSIPDQALFVAVKGFVGNTHIQSCPNGDTCAHEIQRIQQAPEIQSLGGDLRALALLLKLKKSWANCSRYFFFREGNCFAKSRSRFSGLMVGIWMTENREVRASFSSWVPAYP